MKENYWLSYLRQTAGDDSAATIAKKCDISRSTVSRWMHGSIPSPIEAINFARAYNQPPTQALVVAGYLSPSETGLETVRFISVQELSDAALLQEIERRFKR